MPSINDIRSAWPSQIVDFVTKSVHEEQPCHSIGCMVQRLQSITDGSGPKFGIHKALKMNKMCGSQVPLIFSGCAAKCSPFTLGVWGWGRVCSRLLLQSQPYAAVSNPRVTSALVRKHPQDLSEGPMAVPMASAARDTSIFFGNLKGRATLFCVAGMALRDVLTCQRKSFCVTGAALSRPSWSFCVAGTTL